MKRKFWKNIFSLLMCFILARKSVEQHCMEAFPITAPPPKLRALTVLERASTAGVTGVKVPGPVATAHI